MQLLNLLMASKIAVYSISRYVNFQPRSPCTKISAFGTTFVDSIILLHMKSCLIYNEIL